MHVLIYSISQLELQSELIQLVTKELQFWAVKAKEKNNIELKVNL